jgi:hypothetical protein
MDLNLTKLFNSCKSEDFLNTIKQKKHWLSSKTLKSHKTSQISNKSQHFAKENPKLSNFQEKPSYPIIRSLKLSSIQNDDLSLLSKKVQLLEKSRLFKTPVKIIFDCSQQGKVCHTYALPKKLKSVKKESLEKVEASRTSLIERKVIVSRKVTTVKQNIFQVKDFSSKALLKKNDYFKESYLKDLTEKLEEDKN